MISLIDIFLKIIDIMVYIGFDDFFIFEKDVLEKKRSIEYDNEYDVEIIKKCVKCGEIINGEIYCYKDNIYCSEECRYYVIEKDNKKSINKVETLKNGYRK